MKRGKLVVIVAPSGTGKSTLIEKLMSDVPSLTWSVSLTTRPRRPGETDGVDYHFVSEDEFLTKIKSGEFVEWAKVHSNYYGSSKSFVEKALQSGRNVLLDLDVQGCDSFRRVFGSEAKIIFIEPPSVEELEKRLKARGTEPELVIQERVRNAKNELLRKNDFDYLIRNDNFDRALKELKNTVNSILKD